MIKWITTRSMEKTQEDRKENLNVKSPKLFGSLYTEDQVNDVDVVNDVVVDKNKQMTPFKKDQA